MSTIRRVEFTNSRGLSVTGLLWGTGTTSAVILAYGFSDDSGQARVARLADSLARAGWAVLSFKLSGPTGIGHLEDLDAAARLLSTRGFAEAAIFCHTPAGVIFRCPASLTAPLSTSRG